MGTVQKKQLRPPITLPMLLVLKSALNLHDPFDACIWVMSMCAFWGMMRFGEVSVKSRAAFNPAKNICRKDVLFGKDQLNQDFARLDLPSAKTAAPGEIQRVHVLRHNTCCPIDALVHLSRLVPAGPSDPLFSWKDKNGQVRPMVRSKALQRINSIFSERGWGTSFGHSFRIGGASHYLAQGVNPDIVKIGGRWKSNAYELYIRSFELILSRRLAPS